MNVNPSDSEALSEETARELLRRLAKGDEDASVRLSTWLTRELAPFARGLAVDLADVVQDALVRLLENADSIAVQTSARGYILTVGRNAARALVRRRAPKPESDESIARTAESVSDRRVGRGVALPLAAAGDWPEIPESCVVEDSDGRVIYVHEYGPLERAFAYLCNLMPRTRSVTKDEIEHVMELREILAAYYFRGETFDEIAEQRGLSVSTVWRRHQEALGLPI